MSLPVAATAHGAFAVAHLDDVTPSPGWMKVIVGIGARLVRPG
ncbi:hypothetical protein [Bradyrhizobium sp.]|nr:hypothetical protein [Bradyrhizobium sp.]